MQSGALLLAACVYVYTLCILNDEFSAVDDAYSRTLT
jgi:hypothetical protein